MSIEFQTDPSRYRHWKLGFDGPVAVLKLDVDERGGLVDGYELKLNSYDLAVDIELNDAIQRLRFEHPEIRTVLLTSAKERVFSAGANIRMLASSTHPFKVNFCKFTNETRLAMEDASAHSGQFYMSAIAGSCAGGGYELALATGYVMMADDGSTNVSLPEVPLLAVLPGTGGLTRLVDKRRVRRDRADFFCTTEEGLKGRRAAEWGLVDEVVPRTKIAEHAMQKAREFASNSDRPLNAKGIALQPLGKTIETDRIAYKHLRVEIDRSHAIARLTAIGPDASAPARVEDAHAIGCGFWPLAFARELEDAILHLRFNEEAVGTWIFHSEGDSSCVKSYDEFLIANRADWLVREICLYLKRTFKRIDVSARSIFALIEPGSCFHGTLMELALAADRIYMLRGTRAEDELPAAKVALSGMNFGPLPMSNGLSRIENRFSGDQARLDQLRGHLGVDFDAEQAEKLGLATFVPDEIDWDDEIRIAIEERAAFSADALTGMEASLRFCGPETMESKIFARLSAWQNWIFQRPNAIGDKGALKLFGSGRRPEFDPRRT